MLVTLTPIVAFAGSVMSARANDMNLLIAGGVLYGVTLATIGVVGTIPAEILPLKYRTVASGIGFLGGASGGLYVAPNSSKSLLTSYPEWLVLSPVLSAELQVGGGICFGYRQPYSCLCLYASSSFTGLLNPIENSPR